MRFSQFKTIGGTLLDLRQVEVVTPLEILTENKVRFDIFFKSGNVIVLEYIENNSEAIQDHAELSKELKENY